MNTIANNIPGEEMLKEATQDISLDLDEQKLLKDIVEFAEDAGFIEKFTYNSEFTQFKELKKKLNIL